MKAYLAGSNTTPKHMKALPSKIEISDAGAASAICDAAKKQKSVFGGLW
jgi:hypothetical protein